MPVGVGWVEPDVRLVGLSGDGEVAVFPRRIAKVEVGELHARVGGNGSLKLGESLGALPLAEEHAAESVQSLRIGGRTLQRLLVGDGRLVELPRLERLLAALERSPRRRRHRGGAQECSQDDSGQHAGPPPSRTGCYQPTL